MEKTRAVFAGMYVTEGKEVTPAPDSFEETLAKVHELIDSYGVGAVVSEEDIAILRGYLPALGCDETELGESDAYQGRGSIDLEKEVDGLSLKVTAAMDNTSMWAHTRRQWSGHTDLQKLAGDKNVLSARFDYRFVSFGVGETGEFIVLYKGDVERIVDSKLINSLAEGELVSGSRFDTSKGAQWGFFMETTITLETEAGTIVM